MDIMRRGQGSKVSITESIEAPGAKGGKMGFYNVKWTMTWVPARSCGMPSYIPGVGRQNYYYLLYSSSAYHDAYLVTRAVVLYRDARLSCAMFNLLRHTIEVFRCRNER
jgi:hypothetical protein